MCCARAIECKDFPNSHSSFLRRQLVSFSLLYGGKFRLVDQEEVAYKGTTADCVNLPSKCVIAQFRDAVYAKNLRKLSRCDASDLLVYANLQPEDSIGHYGASDAKMYVVVPESAARDITAATMHLTAEQVE
jgi:hypothetical protein